MADDTTVQITIAADLDGSVAAAATAAKEQIDQLTASGADLAEISGTVSQGLGGVTTAATTTAAATETAAAGAKHAGSAFISMESAAQVGERMFERLTLAAAVFGAIDFEKSAFGNAADIQRTADMLGLTTDQVQAFQYAMRQAGADTDTGTMALRRFMSNMGELQSGGEAASAVSDAIKTIGLTADELAGDPFAALQKVAQGILNEKDATTQAYVEHELFGRSGQELNAVLTQLASGFDATRQKAADAGEMLDSHTTKGALETEVAFANLTTKLKDDFAEGILDAVQGLENLGTWLSNIWNSITGPFVAALKAGYDAANAFDAAMWPKGGAAFNQQLDARIAKVKEYEATMKALPSTAGGLGMQMEAPTSPTTPTAPTINIVSEKQAQDQANKAAEIAQRLSDTIAQDANALAQKQISAAESANNFELQMGDESLDQWKANATEEANAKLAAELAYLQKKAAADKGNVVEEQKDLDAIKAAHQENANALAAIDQQYAEKKRAQDQTDLQDYIKTQEDGVTRYEAAEAAKLKSHQVSAQAAHDADLQELSTVEANVLAEYDAVNAGLQQGTEAYDKAMKDRAALVDWFTQRSEAANNQLTDEESQKWTQLGNSIKSSFNSALDGMLFQAKTFGQAMFTLADGIIKAFLSMGEEIGENWLQGKITSLFSSGGAAGGAGAASGAGSQAAQTTALTGNTSALTALTTALTAHGAELGTNTAGTLTNTASTTTNTASNVTHTGATVTNTGATVTHTASTLTNTGATITDTGATTVHTGATLTNVGATMTGAASTSVAAVSTDANTLATIGNTLATWAAAIAGFFGFATGADNIPHDMVANIHKGEMVVPAGPAQVLRDRIGAYQLSDMARGAGDGYQLSDLIGGKENNGYELNDLAKQSFGGAGAAALDGSHFGGGNVTNNGGDTHNWSFSPSIRGVPQMDVMKEMYAHESEFKGFITRLVRNGSLRF